MTWHTPTLQIRAGRIDWPALAQQWPELAGAAERRLTMPEAQWAHYADFQLPATAALLAEMSLMDAWGIVAGA